jgi:hypothetical protein
LGVQKYPASLLTTLEEMIGLEMKVLFSFTSTLIGCAKVSCSPQFR